MHNIQNASGHFVKIQYRFIYIDNARIGNIINQLIPLREISSISEMQTLQYCMDMRTKLNEVKSMQISTKTKIMLIESLRYQLRCIYELQSSNCFNGIKFDLSESTAFSGTKSIAGKSQKQEQQSLIEQILKKQKVKIEIDQQIQTVEDDLNEISKIVQTKNVYNQELDSKIAMVSKQIQKESVKQKQNKHIKIGKDKKQPKDIQKQGKDNADVNQSKQQKLSLSILQKVKSTPSLLKKIFS